MSTVDTSKKTKKKSSVSKSSVSKKGRQKKCYDVVVVGGGMVGASFACALAGFPENLSSNLLDKKRLNIAVIESRPVPNWSKLQGHDLRVSAITRASECFLRNIGVWGYIQQRRISPFREMQVWDSSGSGEIHFDTANIGEAYMGHIIENNVIQLSVLQRLDELENVDYYGQVEAEQLTTGEDLISLTLADGQCINAKLIVGADGSNSWVREQANIKVKGWDYQQKAVVTTVKTSHYHAETAWQRFLPEGPLAFLPLSDGYCSIVWSTSTKRAEQLLALDDAKFIIELENAFDHKLGQIESVSTRAAFSLKLQHAINYVRPQLALMGDAAHTVHPLAGQGVNLGFMDAATLCEVITNAIVNAGPDKTVDPGAFALLRKYERWRKTDNLATLAAMDMFKKVFGNDLSVVRWMRNTGLNMTHRLDPLKNIIMRHTMGLSGDLPELAKPDYFSKFLNKNENMTGFG